MHWHLVEPAIFVLGLDEAEDAAVFHGIVAIHRNTHGDVFVADGSSREIRVFDRNGQFVRRFGGPGGGPGEFATLRGVGRIAADTLFGLDSFAARVTIMHEDGTVIRTVRLNTGPSEWLARAKAGYVAGASRTPLGFPVGTRAPEHAQFLLFNEEGDTIRTLATLRMREHYRVQAPAGVRTTTVPFDPRGQIAFGEDFWYYAWPSEWMIVRGSYAASSTADTIRLGRSLRQLPAEAIEAWIDNRLVSTPPNELPAMRRYWSGFPYRETVPVFDRMLLDTEGQLWLREYLLHSDASATWVVLAGNGALLAELRTFPDLEPMFIGPDVVMGVRRDADDREYVVAYELRDSQP